MNDQELNAVFCEWADWCRSKRLYSPNPNPRSIIGRLRLQAGLSVPPDRDLSADMARLPMCEGKQQFADRKRAHMVAQAMNRRPGRGNANPYRCRHCGSWHVGSAR